MSSEAATHPQPSPPSRIAGLVAWPRRLPGTLALGLIGSALLWLAQPPACLSLLAWLAPMPWLLVALGEDPLGRRGWLKLWAAGAAYWAAAVWWVVLPHPLTPLGLPFLAGYLGMYLPTFVWLVRAALRHTPLPLWVAAPAAWVGLEWLQSHLFTGFAIAGLAHTQAWWPSVIQIASFGGAYAVSFVMLMFAAGVVDGARAVQRSRDRSLIQFDPRPPVAFFAATVPVAVTLFTGHFRATSGGIEIAPSVGTATVALLQSDIRATWDPDPKRSERIMQRMLDLSKQAARQAEAAGKTLDLIVWPESMFRTPVWTFADQFTPPPELNPAYAERAGYAQRNAQAFAIWTGTPTLFGIDRYNYPGPFIGDVMEWEMTFHNSAALADAQGNFVAVYDKMHRVPFGEYIPLFENLPALYYLTPLSGGITPGERPVAMEARGARREARTPEEGLAS
ncbi:MAG: apolipoprotein N-acyltransferase, partial [Planctomycetota bacterium]